MYTSLESKHASGEARFYCVKLVAALALVTTCCVSHSARAATVQLLAGLESSEFLDGANLSDDSPTVFLSADWTFDQGSFAGLDCYVSTADISQALDQGCDFYAGYFKPINESNALSLQLTRHQYSRGFDDSWDFSDLALSWHPSKRSSFTATYSNKWLSRPFDTYALKADTQVLMSERIGLNLSASLMAIESGAPVSSLAFAKVSLSYTRARWAAELGVIYTDKDQRRMLPFDIDQAELLLSLSYRLY